MNRSTPWFDELAPEEAADHGGVMAMHENTLTLVLLALGDALMGKALARSLNLPESAARDRAEALLTDSIAAGARRMLRLTFV